MNSIAIYEDDLYGEKEIKEKTEQYLVFVVSGEWYACKALSAIEIMLYPHITFLPNAPSHVIGITNLRGEILSIIDLRKVFMLPEEPITDRARIVVVEVDAAQSGLLVDEVYDVISVPVSKIEPTPDTLDKQRSLYIDGGFKVDNRFVGIANLPVLLGLK